MTGGRDPKAPLAVTQYTPGRPFLTCPKRRIRSRLRVTPGGAVQANKSCPGAEQECAVVVFGKSLYAVHGVEI
jgi:hypothetical protein